MTALTRRILLLACSIACLVASRLAAPASTFGSGPTRTLFAVNTSSLSLNQALAQEGGDYEYSLQHAGETRTYLFHVPASYQPGTPVPLVLAFHGAMGNAEIEAAHYGWVEKSDAEGFLVAFPNGASRLPSGDFATWNAGECCGYARQSQSDDVGFVEAVIEEIRGSFNLSSVFATGMSNGGMFAHRLACERPDLFDAIGAVAGTNNFAECDPTEPISVLHIHSLQDDHILFEGGCGPACIEGEDTDYVSVPDTIAGWVARDNCNATPEHVEINENAYSDTYSGCDGNVEVKLIVTRDGGHSWPGAPASARSIRGESGPPSQAVSATDEIWAFFEQAALNG